MAPTVTYDEIAEVSAQLGFSRREEVVEDGDGRGLKRAITRPLDGEFARQFEYRQCRVKDWSAPGSPQPQLLAMGFEAIDLGAIAPLQALLADLRRAGKIEPEQARALRRQLNGRVFPLGGGKCLKLLQVATEGLIMRTGGPNGLKVDPDLKVSEMNGHDVALAIHGDQDVRGTPLKQIMRGYAPWMFRHQTPDGSNRLSPLMLVNLWIPLQQITRPLSLMDRRTLDAREQQLRYALPTETFLDRREDMRFNDIWAFLHDAGQQWYFHSHMGHDQAYVFDTLGEPHGSFILPGEDVAEHYYLQLSWHCARLRGTDALAAADASPPTLAAETTAPLRAAIASMQELLARAPGEGAGAAIIEPWLAQADTAMASVVRKSLEMRVVALVLPNVWPFNRRHKKGLRRGL